MSTSLVCDADGSRHSQSRCTQQKVVARFLIGDFLVAAITHHEQPTGQPLPEAVGAVARD
jgi:hypothetical protein